jgi:predicted anti-sigma-YlaC factor YlaD
MLTCRELTEVITDYLEGCMPLVRRLQFQFHLGMCGRCRAYLRQMRTTVRLLGRLPDEPMPADIAVEMLRRFRNWKGGPGNYQES